jgi:hypothetical protein
MGYGFSSALTVGSGHTGIKEIAKSIRPGTAIASANLSGQLSGNGGPYVVFFMIIFVLKRKSKTKQNPDPSLCDPGLF